MIVYTTYLSNRGLINHDNTYEINIMRYPRYISKDKNSRHYPDLSPSGELLNNYKQKKINFDTFKKEFWKEINNNKKALYLLNCIEKILDRYNICFVCCEKDYTICHRYLLAEFFIKKGFEWKELTKEKNANDN